MLLPIHFCLPIATLTPLELLDSPSLMDKGILSLLEVRTSDASILLLAIEMGR